MDLLLDGASLQAGASAVRGTADAVHTAADLVDRDAGDCAYAAGHAHVRDGLDEFARFHSGVLTLLAVAVEAVAQEMTAFDQCMGEADRDLAAGC